MNITIKNNDSTLRETFWTDATEEDILWSIKIHNGRYDMIRKWDREKIMSNIGWVSYHLRRAGFEVSEKKHGEPTFVKIVEEMDLVNE
jgi:hypothetical protein